MVRDKSPGGIIAVHPELCIECGHCEAVCPKNAISGPVPTGELDQDYRSRLPTPESLQLLLETRRSVRKYKPEPIRDGDLARILEAGRPTPTGSNSQDINYVVVNDPAKMAQIREIALPVVAETFSMASRVASLPFSHLLLGRKQAHKLRHVYGPAIELFMQRNRDGDDRLFYHAPALMVTHGEKRDEAAAFSSHIAMFDCSLMAHLLGVGCLLNSFTLMAVNRSRELREMFGIPRGDKAYGAMTMGYQDIEYHRHVHRRPVQARFL
jgi:nitroreductase